MDLLINIIDKVDPNIALGAKLKTTERDLSPKDCILYAIAIGCAQENPTDLSELRFTYEGAKKFAMFPTMGVTMMDFMDVFSGGFPGMKFNPMMLLHGEQEMQVLHHPLPTRGKLVTEGRIAELWDKGKAGLLVLEFTTKDEKGTPLFLNRMSAFIRGIGGWGGERGPNPPSYKPPARAADAVHSEKTNKNQALLYRFPSGDTNPLHADPQMAAMGGFDKPILHGLCTFGFASRAVLKAFANNDPARFKSINVRFTGHVFPGESLETSMWKVEDNKILIEVKSVERGTVVLSNAVVEFYPEAKL